MRILLFFFIISFISPKLQAQDSIGLPPAAVMIDLAYGMQLPEGDMKTNFNYNYNIGSRVSYLTGTNWIFGVGGAWLFSDNIKTDVLAPLRIENGLLIERTGRMGLTQLGERGFTVNGEIGKLIPLTKRTRLHNLEFRVGAGYLQHWIRIRLLGYPEDLPQLLGEYLRGYDRKTSGIALNQYIGYRFMSKSKLVNLFIGVDFTEGFTYNRRYYNFDTREIDNKLKKDILLGFKAGFCIPFFVYTKKTRTEDLEFY